MINKLTKENISGLNNLLPLDWNFDYEKLLNSFIDEPYFHSIILSNRESVYGTGNVIFNDNVGWLGNIIVSQNMRRKGFGEKITKYLVGKLKSNGCETQLLIATKLGEPVYKKLGFYKISEYLCFDSIVPINSNYTYPFQNLEYSHLKDVMKLDKMVNDENRSHLIRKFYNRGKGYFNEQNELIGFYLPEFGRGLIISLEKEIGFELLRMKHSQKGKRTLLPIENIEGIDFLTKLGLHKGSLSSRMILGKENQWKPNYIYSYGSGYCG